MTDDDKLSLAQQRAVLVEHLATPLVPEDRVRLQGELSILNAKIKALNTIEAARLKATADRRRSAGLAEAQANASRARTKLAAADTLEASEGETDEGQAVAIDAWIVAVLRRGGLKVHVRRGEILLEDAPARWTAIVEALRDGLHAVARGQELPEVVPAPKTKRA